MGTIIGFCSQKGGVAKSTLCRSLAREAIKSGLTAKIADIDAEQGTSTDWGRLRMSKKIEPGIPVEPFATAAQALAAAPLFDLLLIDAPGRSSVATLEVARVADLIVQPTGASLDDLRPAVREFHALVNKGIPANKLVFALCRIGTETEEADARRYLTDAGYSVLAGALLERPAYRKALNVGKTVTETSFSQLNERADALLQALIDRVGGEHG